MTVPILHYVRERRYSQASIPEGQLALYEIIYEMARHIDALESDVSVLRDAQSESGGFVRVAHRDYTDALRWLEIAATGDLDHSTRISLIEDAVGALHKCSKDEGKL